MVSGGRARAGIGAGCRFGSSARVPCSRDRGRLVSRGACPCGNRRWANPRPPVPCSRDRIRLVSGGRRRAGRALAVVSDRRPGFRARGNGVVSSPIRVRPTIGAAVTAAWSPGTSAPTISRSDRADVTLDDGCMVVAADITRPGPVSGDIWSALVRSMTMDEARASTSGRSGQAPRHSPRSPGRPHATGGPRRRGPHVTGRPGGGRPPRDGRPTRAGRPQGDGRPHVTGRPRAGRPPRGGRPTRAGRPQGGAGPT